jgi:Outer membrane protein beta-barrel domain
MIIKVVILSISLVILPICSLYSQPDLSKCVPVKKSTELEVFFMPSRTQLWGDVNANLHTATNFSTGGTFAFVRNRSVLRAGLMYEQKGWSNQQKITISDEFGDVVASVNVKIRGTYYYLTLPIQYGLRFGQAVKFEPAVGLYASYLLKSTVAGKQDDGFSSYVNTTDHYNKIDYGFVGSVRALVPIKSKMAVVIGIYDYLGFANINGADIPDKTTPRHHVFGLSIGLTVKLKERIFQ